jgi:predicted nucleic acid-binding protein
MAGLTLDTGALVALERRKQRVVGLLTVAHEDGWSVTAPSTAIAEWWRGRTDMRESILAAIEVEPVSLALARLAGEAMARVRGATLADAIVMVSAARRGDRVLTGDVHDFEKLGAYFPSVKVLGI